MNLLKSLLNNIPSKIDVYILALIALQLSGCGGGGSSGGNGTQTPANLISITITPATLTVANGQNAHFYATGSYTDNTTADITSQVAWASASTVVATINSSTGIAFGVSLGATTVTALANSIISNSATLTVTPIPVPVPDTGQTQSYTTTPGEDSDYAINTPSFTDNSNGTVTDNITGLMWTQTISSGPYSFSGATNYCVSLNLAGNSDWRLPNIHELSSIINYGTSYPSIDTSIFLGSSSIPLVGFWSSDVDVTDSTKAWFARYSGGWIATSDKSALSPQNDAICVRGTVASKSYENVSSLAIRDNITGLIWQKGSSTSVTWEGAIQYCENLFLDGRTDWRLPNIKELFSIVDTTTYSPAINSVYFSNTSSNYYWSSTHQTIGATNAWPVDFGKGFILNYAQSSTAYAKCVTW